VSALTLLAAPLVVAGVFLLSGVAKLGDVSDGVRGLRELQVPDVLVRDWVARAHPIAEIVIALGLLVLPTPWRAVAAVAAVGLMAAYTVLVIAAVRRAREVQCNCFGRRSEVINRRTAVRNLALLALALLALIDCREPSAPILRVFSGLDPLVWSAIIAVTAGVAWLIGRGYAATPAPIVAPTQPVRFERDVDGDVDRDVDHDFDDDARLPIPDRTLTKADGTTTTLTELVAHRAAVLLFLEPTCGSCARLLEEMPGWRAMMPEITIAAVRVRFAADEGFGHGHGHGQTDEAAFAPGAEPFPTRPGGYWTDSGVISAFGVTGFTPWGVLLGADGLIAGGPEVGYPRVRAFLVEVLTHLAGLA
jgi:hypothetical protein